MLVFRTYVPANSSILLHENFVARLPVAEKPAAAVHKLDKNIESNNPAVVTITGEKPRRVAKG